ncbi:MAG TPA: UbiH/UbiF/VisC/COQ6 family ubiquinone biosynthesis hydroxylase [Stellaceae bacterium]|nr:UbiH/UbiF/VisC/COQ6 family ubiquinone biosynthesis hydroxylase [Stellaceae bacterium]
MPRQRPNNSPDRPQDIRADIAVVGGGLSGLALAIACAAAGIETAVIDRADPAKFRDAAYDGRTTAIAYGSQQALKGIGVWDALAPHAEPIREIRVVDGDSPLFLHYDRAEIDAEALGYIVENRLLRGALQARAEALPSLTLQAPSAVEQVEFGALQARLSLSDGGRIAAALVVGADGRDSPMRAAAGITTWRKSYHQIAIVCVVRHEKPHHGVAVEHFRAAGPFAILPMATVKDGTNRSSIVWTEDEHEAPLLLALDDKAFARQLASRFGDFLGRVAPEPGRWSYPLALIQAERYAAPRLALIGDAAHVIHPIAGQGWNLGVRDVAALAELLVDAHRLGIDLGSNELLRRYERWRRFDSLTLTTVTDGLNRLFANDFPPLKLARDLGLAAVNHAPGLKRFFMRHAMGVTGDLPRLVKGESL